MLTTIARGLLFRLLGYGLLLLGFWLLLQAFQRPSVLLGILGGLLIPGGMYLIVMARRSARPSNTPASNEEKQGEDIDPVD